MPTQGFARICRGRKVCDITGHPHAVVKGADSNGNFWTLVAEPYPEKLCRAFAVGVDHGVHELAARDMAAILGRRR